VKAILEFDLPEERDEYLQAVHAADYGLAMWDFQNYLRGHLKYGENPELHSPTVEAIQAKFFEILNERNLELP
jgi:hypothetical protein